VLTVDYAVWGALPQTVNYQQSISSVVELKRAIAKAWQKHSRSSTSVGEGRRRLQCASLVCIRYIVIRQTAALFSKVYLITSQCSQ